jgi:Tfp pilus assembly protein PilF
MAETGAMALAQAGDRYLSQGLFGESLLSYQQALQLEPTNIYWRFLAGECLFHLERFADAVALLTNLSPGEDAVLAREIAMTLGRAQQAMGLKDQAEANLLKAFVLDPTNEQTAYNLAVFYEQEKLPVQAVQFLKPSAAIHPQSVPLHFNLGTNLMQCGSTAQAIEALEATLELSPGHIRAHQNLALGYLQIGLLSEGWKHYAWRFNRHEAEGKPANWQPRTPELPDDLEGREICIHGEQGIGDELFFMRFLPVLIRRGAKVIYLPCNPKLGPLLEPLQAHGLFTLRTTDSAATTNAIHLYAADLPLALGAANAIDYPSAVPLQPDASLCDAWQQKFPMLSGSRPRLGITWRAGTQHAYGDDDPNRWLSKSVPLEALMDALVPLNADIIVMQRNPSDEELQYVRSRVGAERYLDASQCGDDLAALLALLACLDSLVGVSNTNVHLFAGLGKSGHVLVPVPYEFRWQQEDDTSPWFPEFSVYRQCPITGWGKPMAQLTSALGSAFSKAA